MLVALLSFRADFTAAIRSTRLNGDGNVRDVVDHGSCDEEDDMQDFDFKCIICTKYMRSHHLLVNNRKHIANDDGDYEDYDVVDFNQIINH